MFIIGLDPKQIKIEKEEISIPDSPAADYLYPELKTIIKNNLDGHTLSSGTWNTLQRHKAHHSGTDFLNMAGK
ncbi:MAG: hypothetical protein PHP23_03340 [Desulfobacterales bacterium]|nr:hypothetical protein [Desulfobacterales bacterium]MDD4073367.1 hypothetical protein [Desulfobacterales bacterium]MDD4393882.1 hypothetical protein [Desulfobacterales bacterium]